MRRRAAVLLTGIAILLTLVRVAATHRVFSQTVDEPAHVAAGYDWLAGAPYTIDATHPPLARALAAVPAWMGGVQRSDSPSFIDRGNVIFYANGRYEHNVAGARLGNLLLLAVGMIGVAFWAGRHHDALTAPLAAVLFASPAVLGHAGVATTDLAVAAMFPISLVALEWWIEKPSPRRAVVLGLAVSLGVLSKFSFLMFFPVGAIAVLVCTRARWVKPLRQYMSFFPAMLVAALIIWAGYRFETGTIAEACGGCEGFVASTAPANLRPFVERIAREVSLPAPMFFVGVAAVKDHSTHGHISYFRNEYRENGWWYYFPLIFFYKSPIALLLLFFIGAWCAAMQSRQRGAVVFTPLLVALALLVSVLPTSINIGIRHILPLYAPVAVVAAAGLAFLWRSPRVVARGLAVVLAGWFIANGIAAHPDYLAWFNEAAGAHPEQIAVDSNLDWGQDILRLRRVLRARGITHYGALVTTTAYLDFHAPGAESLPQSPKPGWYVVSETALKFDGNARAGRYNWLVDYYPVTERIGKSLRLYEVK